MRTMSGPPVEGAAVAEFQPGEESDEAPETYGGRKAACERIVEEAFGERALVVRPGLIVGPHDPTGRFTYWPHRVARGGEVLAPGFARVRGAIHRRSRSRRVDRPGHGGGLGGTYNATGETMPLGDLLAECIRVHGERRDASSGSPVTSSWQQRSDRGWSCRSGCRTRSPGGSEASIERARAEGLTFRPLADTVLGTLEHAEPVGGVGLTPERERELLATSG